MRLPRFRALTLRVRISLLTLLTTLAALVMFGAAAFVVISIDESEENDALVVDDVRREVGGGVLAAMAIATPLALLTAVASAYWLGMRALTPIEEVIRSAQEVSAQSLRRRLAVPEARDQMRDLALAQNALFARLEEGFAGLAQFAADVSHELRTPLATVVNDLEVTLRRPRTPDEWQETGRRSLEELLRLNRLIEALLLLARVDAPTEQRGVSSLGRVLEDVHARFASEAGRRGVTLEFPDGTDGLQVAIGEEALTVALANLVGNATRHAAEDGRVVVGLEVGERAIVWIHVDDDGEGVATEDVDHIFDAFKRGSRPVDDGSRSAGVGLGLTLAKRVIQRHGGEIVVGRAPIGGARFSMSVPVGEEAIFTEPSSPRRR